MPHYGLPYKERPYILLKVTFCKNIWLSAPTSKNKVYVFCCVFLHQIILDK